MLAKLTSKNQLTIPKLALSRLPKTTYFDVEVRNHTLLLQPVEVRPLGSKTQQTLALPAPAQQVLDTFVARVRKEYGARLAHIILYGSYARGDQRDYSDLDVLVVLKDLPAAAFSAERRQLHQFAYAVTFGQDIPLLLSALPMDTRQYDAQDSPLAINVHREGIVIA